ncbi:family 20 glycosylhydrolase [Sphingobacterium sp. SGG-5]|uniref:beta-N-acetylhexosaminidase n=1 Tax=Sphingobacterium sp. SGG-5 TaxID=2710881 RepID=UPI0013EE2E28|nr:family 20 glycosylhydrolase [Sphingobacterium sp. SGG-5]NGM61002.1 family 20 glycosylhydrolase [Sphingobacterium sp. SGG-5]
MKHVFCMLIAAAFFIGNTLAANVYHIVPYPNYLNEHPGEFRLQKHTVVVLPQDASATLRRVAAQFVDQLNQVSVLSARVENVTRGKYSKSAIVFQLRGDMTHEAYHLFVDKKGAVIEASGEAGFFYALQTIKQLLPPAIYGRERRDIRWALPCVEIKDTPRFGYRGMHLDVARHFFDVEEVKRYIDILAVHKVNTFHWHLTDDQGWRIAIKKYPKLTGVGSQRKGTVIRKEWGHYDNIPYGGFYTQDQIREIVDYAAQNFITVIPEIDLPGHMVAALASYPQLGCRVDHYEVFRDWGVSEDVLCVGKESTFTFIEDVLKEVMTLFPSKYIHIGGDECPKTSWENCPQCQAKIAELGLKDDEKFTAEHYLQSYTISRVEKFLHAHGRQIIGWDEIIEGGIAPNATIMSWRGTEGGIEAARQNHDVIMTPTSYMYFDYYQSLDTEREPFSFGGFVPVKRVYSFEPLPDELTPQEQQHIIGVQANLWTEYIKTNSHLEYMLLPRLAALSEVQWTKKENKNWDRFLAGMKHTMDIYDTMGYNYAKHLFEVTATYAINPEKKGVLVTLKAQGNAPIYYSIDNMEGQLYEGPVSIEKSGTFKAVLKRDNMDVRPLIKTFAVNKATGNQIVMNTQPKKQFSFAGASVLVDGLRGNADFDTGFWLGYETAPLDITVIFPEPTEVSSVDIGALSHIAAWIFPPSSLSVFASGNGKDFVSVGEQHFLPVAEKDRDLIAINDYRTSFPKTVVKKLRIQVNTAGKIPAWHGGKGENAFLFVDEVIIE